MIKVTYGGRERERDLGADGSDLTQTDYSSLVRGGARGIHYAMSCCLFDSTSHDIQEKHKSTMTDLAEWIPLAPLT